MSEIDELAFEKKRKWPKISKIFKWYQVEICYGYYGFLIKRLQDLKFNLFQLYLEFVILAVQERPKL